RDRPRGRRRRPRARSRLALSPRCRLRLVGHRSLRGNVEARRRSGGPHAEGNRPPEHEATTAPDRAHLGRGPGRRRVGREVHVPSALSAPEIPCQRIMKRRIVLSCLPLLFLAANAEAAEWLPSDARYQGTPVEVANAHLASLGLGGLEIETASVLPVGGHTTVRFVQRHGGLPVIGGQAAIMVAPDGSIDVAVLDLARSLT